MMFRLCADCGAELANPGSEYCWICAPIFDENDPDFEEFDGWEDEIDYDDGER